MTTDPRKFSVVARWEPYHTISNTFTLEEAIATVKHSVDNVNPWSQYEIRHTDGRIWWWDIAGANVTMKEGRVG